MQVWVCCGLVCLRGGDAVWIAVGVGGARAVCVGRLRVTGLGEVGVSVFACFFRMGWRGWWTPGDAIDIAARSGFEELSQPLSRERVTQNAPPPARPQPVAPNG